MNRVRGGKGMERDRKWKGQGKERGGKWDGKGKEWDREGK